jgi:antitoxin (DNA-binding transcriptional repressor) of toxin-antitoxin stability system
MAKSGKRFAVTDRGELVAYLVPAQEEPTTTFQRLVAAGQVRPATGNILDHLYPDPAEPGERPLSEVFREMRDEERY